MLFERAGAVSLFVAFLFSQIAGPSIPVLWAVAMVLLFGIGAALLVLVAPIVHQNFLQQRQLQEEDERKARILSLETELSGFKKQRLEYLEKETMKQRGQIEELQARLAEAQYQYLELRKVADKLELNLEAANDRLLEWENATNIDS